MSVLLKYYIQPVSCGTCWKRTLQNPPSCARKEGGGGGEGKEESFGLLVQQRDCGRKFSACVGEGFPNAHVEMEMERAPNCVCVCVTVSDLLFCAGVLGMMKKRTEGQERKKEKHSGKMLRKCNVISVEEMGMRNNNTKSASYVFTFLPKY